MDLLYLDNLEEFINDEMKIVSYKWLCQKLDVCANTSKQMLFHFAEDHKKKSKKYDINITYLISGVFFDSKIDQSIYRICIVRESDMEAVKSKFSTISSIHIYSIQKSNLKDLNILSSINYEDMKSLNKSTEYCGIVCPKAELRKTLALVNLEDNVSKKVEIKNEIISDPHESTRKNFIVKAGSRTGINKDASTLFKKSDSNSISSSIKIENKENFNNVNRIDHSKSVSGIENRDKSSISSKKGGNAIVKKGKISSFFKKSEPSSSCSSLINNEEKIEVENKSNIKVPEVRCDVKNENKEKFSKSNNKISSPLKISKSKENLKCSSQKPSAKRSRIQIESDSSDEEEESGELMDENPLPPSPLPVQHAEIESDDEMQLSLREGEASASNSSGKVGRFVDKTFIDDEGFIVTKKVYEYVDVDLEEESKVEVDKMLMREGFKEKPKSPLKKSPNKTKQSSIMSFFKAK